MKIKRILIVFYFTWICVLKAQYKEYSVIAGAGISSAGNYDAGLFVSYNGNPGLLGLNYIPKPGYSLGIYKILKNRNKNNVFELGMNAYLGMFRLEYQVVSSTTPRKFESFTRSSNLLFGYGGPGFNFMRQLKESKWNLVAGVDLHILFFGKLSNPKFDSFEYLQIAMPDGRPLLSRFLVMPKLGISYSFRKLDIGLNLQRTVNPFLLIDVFTRKRITYLNVNARYGF